ncbi:hypothetical protein O6H91_02G136400 [Diphasiastrum complanatum]|uniref:Uncharacterized protein n=1 Tax=Diphasiastrum complanatum TaxID=34168 RepID=A0ACC2ELA8_DIPCM|nr:hypothetical protein O6H91_02G136400 [Diphasiastrum complanatum]
MMSILGKKFITRILSIDLEANRSCSQSIHPAKGKRSSFSQRRYSSTSNQQQAHKSIGRMFEKEVLLAVSPLIFVVGVAISLGVVTGYRQLISTPTVLIDKTKRSSLPEIDQPEITRRQGKVYKEGSPLCQLGAISIS